MAINNIDIQDDKGNSYRPMANPDSVIEFTKAGSRTNIASGDTHRTVWGKICKFFADLGTAAFCGLANNLSTTAAGYGIDARQGPVIQAQFNQINSDLAGYQFRVNNGVPEYKAGADAAWVPFKREPIISTASFSWAYSPVQTFPAKEGYKIIGLYVDITGINSSDYVNVNFGISKNLETGKISITGQTGVNIMGKFYCVYA